MQMSILHTIRYVLFGLVLLFSLIVLGLDANLLNESVTFNGFYFVFEALGVAVAVLTLITIIPIVVIDFIRQGAFTSLVATELGWVSVLMILWVATAGDTSGTPVFVGGCSEFSDSEQSNCHQFGAVQAFAWLNFIILLGWLITLIASAAVAQSHGHSNVWTSPVSDTAFFGHKSTVDPSVTHAADGSHTGYPPQQYPGQPAQMQQQGGYAPGYAPGSQQGHQTAPSSQGYHGTPQSQGYQGTPQAQGYQGTPPQGYHGTPPPQQHQYSGQPIAEV